MEKSKTGKVLTDLIKRLKDNENVTVKKFTLIMLERRWLLKLKEKNSTWDYSSST